MSGNRENAKLQDDALTFFVLFCFVLSNAEKNRENPLILTFEKLEPNKNMAAKQLNDGYFNTKPKVELETKRHGAILNKCIISKGLICNLHH